MRNLTIGLVAALIALTACADHPYNPGPPAVDPNAPVVTITSPALGTFAGDVQNLTDRLNVIDFAGLFSGTALGMPRSGAVRLQAEF